MKRPSDREGRRSPANDNGDEGSPEPTDPRILRIASAIGRQIAREWSAQPKAENDNER